MPEPVDLVDSKDKVIGRITKEEAHEKGLRHKAVHVFTFNPKNELFLQKRSKKKLLAPGLWDSSVGEHVQAGESYEEAALRGLKEELGVRKAKIKELFKISINNKTKTYHNKEFIMLFKAKTNGKMKLSSEAEQGKWFNLERLEKLVNEKPEKFGTAFLKFFKKFLRLKANA